MLMLQKPLTYVVLWLLFQLFVEINCQMVPFRPTTRVTHTATAINNKLYILSGLNVKNPTVEKEFFYLDISVPFNTQELLWRDLSTINTVPPHIGAASVIGGANNNTIFLYGKKDDEKMELVYTFDPQSNTWSIPKIVGINPIRKRWSKGIIDNSGKMYLFGGVNGDSLYLNDMLILDTVNLNWGKGSLIGAPSPRAYYGAALLPNQNIIYVGGLYDGDKGIGGYVELTLSQVYIYNTINDNWSVEITSGNIPSNRDDFSSILGLDGQRIIIFGGTAAAATRVGLAPGDSLYALNLINFEWSIPKVSGKFPSSRRGHQANVIGKYMVITFGEGYDQSTESDILLLDISNNEEYIWTYNFDPSINIPLPSATSTATSPNSSGKSDESLNNTHTPIMIGAIIGTLVGGILLLSGGFFMYKRNKNKQQRKNALLIPGNQSYDNSNSYNSSREKIQSNLTSMNNNNNTTNHEPASLINIPMDNHGQELLSTNNYNHGREAIPAANNENLSTNDIADLRQEIQDLKQLILQNNSSSSKQ